MLDSPPKQESSSTHPMDSPNSSSSTCSSLTFSLHASNLAMNSIIYDGFCTHSKAGRLTCFSFCPCQAFKHPVIILFIYHHITNYSLVNPLFMHQIQVKFDQIFTQFVSSLIKWYHIWLILL